MVDNGDAETAAAAHACFDGNVMVEGYYFVVTAVSEDGERVWAIRADDNASIFTVMGLARLTEAHMDTAIAGMLGYDEAD